MRLLVHGVIIAAAAVLYVTSTRTETRRWRDGISSSSSCGRPSTRRERRDQGWLGIDRDEGTLVVLALPSG